MQPFTLQIPTTIRFGRGVLDTVGAETKRHGGRALLVYGSGSIKKNGVYETVTASLHTAGITVTEFSGVRPNPILSHAEEGARVAREAKVDVIVAAGGGSVIDEAKGIAVGAVETGALWDFYDRKRPVTRALPVIAIQTLPASSTEVNLVSVITNDATGDKYSIRSDKIAPKVAFLDPETTTTIPIEYTAYACTDILSHMMEGYFTSSDPWAPVHDGMVEGTSRAVIDSMEMLLEDPHDIQARAAVMWAGAIAWSGLMNQGVEGARIPNHMLEHPLSGYYDVPHGAGLSIVIPAWLTFARDRHASRIVRFGREVLRIGAKFTGKNQRAQVDLVIETLVEWYRKIGTPTSFAEAHLSNLDFDAMTDQAHRLSKMWGVNYTEEEIRAVYALC